MKTFRFAPWILATAPLLAIVAYWVADGTGQSVPPPPQHQRQSQTANVLAPSMTLVDTSSQFAPDGSRIKQPSQAEVVARERYHEAKEKADAAAEVSASSLRNIAASYTPEFIAKTADSLISRRSKEYQRLFSQWGLDAQTSRDALGILRLREIRLLENRGKFFQNTSSIANAKANAFNNQTEDLLAKEELTLLLGQPRAAELLSTVSRIEKDEFAAALAATGTMLPMPKK